MGSFFDGFVYFWNAFNSDRAILFVAGFFTSLMLFEAAAKYVLPIAHWLLNGFILIVYKNPFAVALRLHITRCLDVVALNVYARLHKRAERNTRLRQQIASERKQNRT